MKRRDRRWYVRPLNTTRDQDGEFVSLVLPMRSMDEERHFQYFRMSAPKFDDLLSRVIRYLPDSPKPALVREQLADYFLSDAGVFPHQYNVLRLGMRTGQ